MRIPAQLWTGLSVTCRAADFAVCCFLLLFSKEKGKKSVLDADPEAQALLEMVGKSRQSEGFRNPEDEDEEN